MLKNLLFITSVVLFSINFVAAQENENKKSPLLLDEYGADLNVSAEIARLDSYAIALLDDPQAKGFIFHYRSRHQLPGAGFRRLKGIENYLIKTRGFEKNRFVLVDGGAVNCPKTELWFAPAGTAAKSKEDSYQTHYVDTESVRKFDEYYYSLNPDNPDYMGIEYGYGFGSVNSLEAYAAALFKEPKSLAYIIVYPQYYVQKFEYTEESGRNYKKGEIISDSPRTTTRIIRAVKNEMIKKYNFPAARLKIVNGGFRKFRKIETWILPRGEHQPVATPDSFPNLRKKKV